MPPRPCPGPPGTRCPTRSLTTNRYCTACQRQAWAQRDTQRGSSTARGYDEAYRTARTALLATHPQCHYCGREATTADHIPSLAQLRRQGLPPSAAQLIPACRKCNSTLGDHTTPPPF